MASERDDVIIKVENVGKEYILGSVTGNTLKEAIKNKLKPQKNEILQM